MRLARVRRRRGCGCGCLLWWMLGRTPPCAMVTWPRSLFSSSSFRMARLEMAGDDARLLVVAGGVASQLENLSGEVLEDGGQVDGSAGTDALGVVALPEETVHATDRERETSLGRPTGSEGRLARPRPCGEARRAMRDGAEGTANFVCESGATGLAAGLAASSHLDGEKGGWEKWWGRRDACAGAGVRLAMMRSWGDRNWEMEEEASKFGGDEAVK